MNDANAKSRHGPRKAKIREYQWRNRGLVMNDGNFLTYEVFSQVEAFQGGCAICHRNGFWNALHADHDKKTGLFRGALCAECNHHAMGTFEKRGHYRSEEHEKILRDYLANTPYQRWLLKKKEDSCINQNESIVERPPTAWHAT
jgi:hypothetical protein